MDMSCYTILLCSGHFFKIKEVEILRDLYLIIPVIYGGVKTDYIGYTNNRMLYLKYREFLTQTMFQTPYVRIDFLYNGPVESASKEEMQRILSKHGVFTCDLNELHTVTDPVTEELIVTNEEIGCRINEFILCSDYLPKLIKSIGHIGCSPLIKYYQSDSLLEIQKRSVQTYMRILQDNHTRPMEYNTFASYVLDHNPETKQPILWDYINPYHTYRYYMENDLLHYLMSPDPSYRLGFDD